MLDEQATSWVASHLGAEVVSVSELTGGIASGIFLVRTTAGEAVLRQLALTSCGATPTT